VIASQVKPADVAASAASGPEPTPAAAPDAEEKAPEPPRDPYATVIADASQIQDYARRFSASTDTATEATDDDSDRTVLAPGLDAHLRGLSDKDDDDDDDKTLLERPGE